MSKRKERITEGLQKIGHCWAMTSDKCILPSDGFDASPSYHVHPDSGYPHVDHILKFERLDDIEKYIKTMQEAESLDEVEAYDLINSFWNEIG